MENNKPINWEKARVHLKKEYPQLTEEDLKYEAGNDEKMLERLEKKINKNRHDIRSWLSLLG